MALLVKVHEDTAVVALELDDDLLAMDLADLADDELAGLEAELVADLRIAAGLCRAARNRRMRERGPLAGA